MATKDTYYFKHDCNARNDIKLIRVRRKFKMEGYGAYFAIIEILREQTDHKLLLSDISDIAFDLCIAESKLLSIIKDFNLFRIDDSFFWSDTLLRRMDDYNELKTKRIEAGKKGRAAQLNKQSPKDQQANAGQTPSTPQALDYTTLHYTTLQETTTDNNKDADAADVENSEKIITGVWSIEALRIKAMSDSFFKGQYHQRGVEEKLLSEWLNNFNKFLQFTGSPTMQTEPDYRKWFSNWLPKVLNKFPDAHDYTPINDPQRIEQTDKQEKLTRSQELLRAKK
jgi:hypothetical protein